jgi:hypothetical protein
VATVNSETFEIDWDLDLSMVYLYKIQNGEEYFLYDVDHGGATLWTTRIVKAMSFTSEAEANEFKDEYLQDRDDFSITKK